MGETCHGKRSPMMRMSGPDIWTTIGFSAASDVVWYGACASGLRVWGLHIGGWGFRV